MNAHTERKKQTLEENKQTHGEKKQIYGQKNKHTDVVKADRHTNIFSLICFIRVYR